MNYTIRLILGTYDNHNVNMIHTTLPLQLPGWTMWKSLEVIWRSYPDCGVGSVLQQAFDRTQAQVGGGNVESRAVVEITAGGVEHCGGRGRRGRRERSAHPGRAPVDDHGTAVWPPGRLAGWVATSGFGRLQQHSDQFGDVKVSGVVQGVHVGPAAPQTDVGAQRDQLTAETQRCGRVTCTHGERAELSEQARERSRNDVSEDPKDLVLMRLSKETGKEQKSVVADHSAAQHNPWAERLTDSVSSGLAAVVKQRHVRQAVAVVDVAAALQDLSGQMERLRRCCRRSQESEALHSDASLRFVSVQHHCQLFVWVGSP